MILHSLEAESSPPVPSSTITKDPAFVALSGGRLLVRKDYVERFRDRGWNSASDVIDANDLAIFRRLADRENGIVSWDEPPREACRSFIKRHVHPVAASTRPWSTRQANLAGWKEGLASELCRQAGVGVAPVVAVGVEESSSRASARSFFMSEELVGFLPADDFAEQLATLDPSNNRRRAFVSALADVARRLHTAHLYHRDFYWCHLFVREVNPARFDIRLIDLQRVDRPRWRHLRWRIKDMAQFLFSAPAGFLTGQERLDWFMRYLGRAELNRLDRVLFAAVEIRAEIYRWRESNR